MIFSKEYALHALRPIIQVEAYEEAHVGIARLSSIKETKLYKAAGRLLVQLDHYISKRENENSC
jgi:hypothetical protein